VIDRFKYEFYLGNATHIRSVSWL